MKQQFLDGKIVRIGQLNDFDTIQTQLIDVLLKLSILVLPEDVLGLAIMLSSSKPIVVFLSF